jgi:hypothetical protein
MLPSCPDCQNRQPIRRHHFPIYSILNHYDPCTCTMTCAQLFLKLAWGIYSSNDLWVWGSLYVQREETRSTVALHHTM